MESQAFVLHSTGIISQEGIDVMDTSKGAIMATPGGGYAAIFGPDGRQLSKNIPCTEEGIVYADLVMDDALNARAFLDVCGHYSRADMLWLGRDTSERKCVTDKESVEENI
jgi:nitrilase